MKWFYISILSTDAKKKSPGFNENSECLRGSRRKGEEISLSFLSKIRSHCRTASYLLGIL